MAEIVNLRQRRKARMREAADARAADNRVKFGLSKRERNSAEDDRARHDRKLDGLKRDREPPDGSAS